MTDGEHAGRSRSARTLATRREIQAAALRLFTERGYERTTVADVAREVGVTERTCFRHFPTKPDLVLWDAADDDLLGAFAAQPAALDVLDAFRAALRTGYDALTAEQRESERLRSALVTSVPELRAAHLDHFVASTDAFLDAVAHRVGRSPDDPEVRATTGALIGVVMTAQPRRYAPGTDVVGEIDAVLGQLRTAFSAL